MASWTNNHSRILSRILSADTETRILSRIADKAGPTVSQGLGAGLPAARDKVYDKARAFRPPRTNNLLHSLWRISIVVRDERPLAMVACIEGRRLRAAASQSRGSPSARVSANGPEGVSATPDARGRRA